MGNKNSGGDQLVDTLTDHGAIRSVDADAQTERPDREAFKTRELNEVEAKNLEKTVDAAIAKASEAACKEKDDTWHWNGIECVPKPTPASVAADVANDRAERRRKAAAERRRKAAADTVFVIGGTEAEGQGQGAQAVNSPQKKCEEDGKEWKNGECVIIENGRFRVVGDQQANEADGTLAPAPASKTTTATTVTQEKCSNWKRDEAFEDDGEVDDSFCDRYATNKDDCETALEEIKNYVEEIERTAEERKDYKDQIAELRKEERELEREKRRERLARLRGEGEDEETEAHSICLSGKCMSVAAYRELSKPTVSQTVGNALSIISGLGLGYLGIREGQKARRETNRLRALQGFEAQGNDIGYTLAGVGLGLSFFIQRNLWFNQGNQSKF